MNSIQRLFTQIPIRARLTLWFVSVMGATLVILSLYLSAQFLHSLSSSIDMGLQIIAEETLTNLEHESGNLAFADTEVSPGNQLSYTSLAVRLVDSSGEVADQNGNLGEQPIWGPLEPGFHTGSRLGDDTQWRTYTVPIRGVGGSERGWLQIVRTLDVLTNIQQDVRDQLLLIIPVLIFGLGAGGYFLAWRALRPIDKITQMADKITTSDLSKRIDFKGPRDEVGRLAATFNTMLGRLQSGFERERRFSADAAHELRTPLSVLKGKLDVTLSRKRSAREYLETLHDLSSQVERLIMLSNGLLILSKLEQRKLEGEQSVVNVVDILESILEEYTPLACTKGIEIICQLPPVMMVKGYGDALLRLFINLMDNAVKYTTGGGRIAVRGAVEKRSCWVELFNSAPDMAEDQIEHLFERFYRADPSRSRHSGGAGLGLSIAKEIVEAHGGKISVSQQPGKGITFRVVIPSNLTQ
jgi:heavy metal sensor kinase